MNDLRWILGSDPTKMKAMPMKSKKLLQASVLLQQQV
jgi:hypothetical protein